jgi:hypothetical protein
LIDSARLRDLFGKWRFGRLRKISQADNFTPAMTEPRRGDSGSPPPGRGAPPPSAARFAGLGFQLLASILLFLYAGRWADAKLGTAPWLLMAGVFVGAAAGFYNLYRQLTSGKPR